MFSRVTQASLDQDPVHLRIASAAVVLGLLATGFVIVSRDAAARGGPAARPPSGLPAARPPSGSRPAQSAGLRLLGEAAVACQSVAYQGVQVIASPGTAGRRVAVVDVWHQRGRRALIQIIGAGPASDTGDGEQDSAPILGITRQMVALLGANYQVAIAGGALADGRPAQVVVVRRLDGGLAARFWLDSATKLPLRRQLFDTHARVISEAAFIDLRLGDREAAGAPAAGARPRSSPLSGGQLSRLRAQGWPLPGPLPGRLTVFEASSTVTASGPVVELADSDDRSVAWSAGGFVYTVIADAPGQTVNQVIAALPHDARPGLAARLTRGLRRLVSWADPFR